MPDLPRIGWIAALETGIAEIDADHRQLVEDADALVTALTTRRPWPEVIALLRRMQADCIAHFAREDRWFAETRFPGAAAHTARHRALEGEIADILAAVEATAEFTPAAAEMALAFRGLLIDHFLRQDLAYKSHLQAHLGR